MPVLIDGQNYYRTVEVCRVVGVSRNTLFRWLKRGALGEPEYRDWREWRLFSEAQVAALKAKTTRIIRRK
jgi:excisionase family DNA binding protein